MSNKKYIRARGPEIYGNAANYQSHLLQDVIYFATDSKKILLDGQEYGKSIEVDNVLDSTSTRPVLNKVVTNTINTINQALDSKVDKVEGKQLSTNDYTDVEKLKLANIQAGAEVNSIETVNGVSPVNENVTITGSNIVYKTGENSTVASEIDNIKQRMSSKLSRRIYASLESIPSADKNTSIVYMIPKLDGEPGDTYDEYLWMQDTDSFEKIGNTTTDFTNYYTKSETDSAISSAIGSITASAPITYSSGNISHNTSGVSAGTYTAANVTVDQYGHVTAIEQNNIVDDDWRNNDGLVTANLIRTLEDVTQQAISVNVENMMSLYVTDMDVENNNNSLFRAVTEKLNQYESHNPFVENQLRVIDCSKVTVNTVETSTLHIDIPCKIIFPRTEITFTGSDENMISIEADGVILEGQGRGSDASSYADTTVLKMITSSSTSLNYHIYSRGHRCITVNGFTMIGMRSTMGYTFGHGLAGCGGIYIEKSNPGTTSSGNTVNNVILENLLISDTIAHAIYIDTPILSTLRNIRISGAGGHGIFINGGTTISLDNIYVSSANMVGITLYGVTYVATLNTAVENSGTAYWLRSCRNVSMFSPGAEIMYNLGQSPWKAVSNSTCGLGITTTDSNGNTVAISDVNTDNIANLRGHGIFITGGSDINIFTPYIKDVGNSKVTASYPSGSSTSNGTRFIYVSGECSGLTITNPGFKMSSSITWRPKHEIQFDSNVTACELAWDAPTGTTLTVSDNVYYTTSDTAGVPIYDASGEAYVRYGRNVLTPTSISANSNQLVTSGVIYTALGNLVSASTANAANGGLGAITINGTSYNLPKFGSTSTPNTSLPIGDLSEAASAAVAVGWNAKASATDAIAIGGGTIAGNRSTVVGRHAKATNIADAVVVGSTASATAANGVVIGAASTASGTGAVSLGYHTVSSAANGVAMGSGTVSSIDNTVSTIGYDTTNSTTNIKTIILRGTDKIFFTNEDPSTTTNAYTALSSFASGKTLAEYLQDVQIVEATNSELISDVDDLF